MRLGFARFVGLAVTFAAFGGVAACIDLFHETSFDTLCIFDASAPGCAGDGALVTAAGDDGAAGNDAASGLPLDICTLDTAAAYAAANHACAWLGACAGSFGGNDPGECLLHARQALDCRVAPARLARGTLLATWRCLATASTCGDVGACLEPGGAESCSLSSGGAFVACASTSQTSANVAVRIACSGTDVAPTAIETCATSGQICGTFPSGNAGAVCGGGGLANGATSTCAVSGCRGTLLNDCDRNGVDRGIDCTNVGAGACIFDRDAGALGCAVAPSSESTVDAGCTASSALTCDDSGVAHGCPSGNAETVDCTELTGSPSCDPSSSGRPWDVARACQTSGACTEICTDGKITACVGGTASTLDCKAEGLSDCTLTQAGGESHPSCVR